MHSFVVFALPRSRTAWLSQFLTYGEWACGHDAVRHLRTMDDVRSWFSQPATGTVETAAAPWWRFLKDRDVRVVTVRRPVEECVASLMRLPVAFDEMALRGVLTKLDRKLDQIEARLPCLSVRFADLADEHKCGEVFEYCLPYAHDGDWWMACAARNVQVNMVVLMRYYAAHLPQLQKLASIAKQATIAGMGRRSDIDGVTIQQEPFDVVFRDGARLFEEHCVAVGEASDNYLTKNLALMRALEGLGWLQFTTARSNGRMLGYLMAVWGPSLESPQEKTAMHTLFFASRDAPPGIGLRLQRVSIEGLKAAGVSEVMFRAGTRGSGPKMGALYRRLGAISTGEMYRLELKAA